MKTLCITLFFSLCGLAGFSQPTRDLRINNLPNVCYFTQNDAILNVFGQVSLFPAAGFVPNPTMDITWPFRAGFYLSTDPVITQDDILIGTYTISSLQINTSHNCSVTDIDLTTIPGLVPGVYYVGIYADDQDDVFEDNEVNNGAAFKDWSDEYTRVTFGTVGIDEASLEQDVELLSTAAGITVQSKTATALTVKVYAPTGTLLFDETSMLPITIPLSDRTGMFLVVIEGQRGIITRKVVI